MKKHIILLGLLATTSLAFAQAGKVGVNTSNPEATLDIRPSAANAATTATTNEGVLIPRVSRDRLKSIATANLKESTLVYVDNISGTTNAVTSNVTSKGFYYYSTTDSKWVKIAEGAPQEQDLRLVGNNNHITQDAGKGGNGTDGGAGSNIAIGRRSMFSITTGVDNVAIGGNSLYSNEGGSLNLALGNSSLYSNTSGERNIGFGSYALYANKVGVDNIAIGANALRNGNHASSSRIAIGTNALMAGGAGIAIGNYALTASTGTYNTAIGNGALKENTTGSNNIAMGSDALRVNTTGTYNLAIGNNALTSNSTGNDNFAMGNNALSQNTTGVYNLALGNGALSSNTTGGSNFGLGVNALRANTTGRNNVGIGVEAMFKNTTGENNIGFGNGTLHENTIGNDNISLGTNSLRNNTTGNNNLAFGTNALYANTTGADNIAMGPGALLNNTVGTNNIGLGTNALRTNTTGKDNVALGSTALFANTTGVNNIAIGTNGLRFNTTGNNNIGFGTNTLRLNTTGDRNIAIGEGTLSGNTIGSYNVGLGISTLNSNTVGVANIGLGVNTLSKNINGSSNIGIGNSALFENVSGNYNIAIGYHPLAKATTAGHNIALGYGALEENLTGSYNIAAGTYALAKNTTGQHNNAQGLNALVNNVTGNNNTAIGNGAGEWVKGHNNVHLGSSTFPTSDTSELDNVVVIGNGINASELTASSGQDNTIILGYKKGHNRSPNIGVGTYKPDAKLHIEANGPTAIKIVDTNQGAGKVLTSDANGVGTWKVPAVAMTQGHLGNPGKHIYANTNTYLYTGSYIDVPARTKYLVTVSSLMTMGNKLSTCHFWLRSMFTTSPTSQTPHGANGKTLISGLLPQGAPYAILQGSIILDNSNNPNIRTYYYMAGSVYAPGCSSSDYLFSYGGTTWGEGAIYGMPIQ